MPGKTYNVNVVAFVFAGKDKGTIYPYQPFRLELPRLKADNSVTSDQEQESIQIVIAFIILAAILAVVIAVLGNPKQRVFKSKLFGGVNQQPETQQAQQELGTYGNIETDSSFADVEPIV